MLVLELPSDDDVAFGGGFSAGGGLGLGLFVGAVV